MKPLPPSDPLSTARPATRRYALATILSTAAAPWVWTGQARAAETRPIHLIVPTPAGSGPDADVRQLSDHLAKLLGQPVIVDNKPGAATRIAAEQVIKSPPDGLTYLVGTPSLATMDALYPKLGFLPSRDLMPVSLGSVTRYALTVNSQVPARSVDEYVRATHSEPRWGNMGTLGIGSISHLTGAWFSSITGAKINFVHYGSTGPFTDLAAGQISAVFDAMLPVLGHVQSGRMRTLGISGKSRNASLPDVPTFAELGRPEFDPQVWIALFAPTGTPAEQVQRMSSAMQTVCKLPETVAARQRAGSESVGSTPEACAAFFEGERQKWGKVIRNIGLTLD